MEPQSLPVHSNLKDIEEQVRNLLRQVRRGDAVAFARWYSLDSEARTRQPSKADIEYVIAREHGFKSWQSLKDWQSHTLRPAPETASAAREPNSG